MSPRSHCFLKILRRPTMPPLCSRRAKANEQTSDQNRALASYRRLYFFAPASRESAEAATAITRLGSTVSPASVEEAITRADRLYTARKFTDALAAYGDAFAKFPATATTENQLRRGIAAYNARKTPDAVAALSAIPTSAGELRAEALFYLAQTYARARQWEQARATVEELRRTFSEQQLHSKSIRRRRLK